MLDLISNEYLILQASLSGKKVLMQKQGNESMQIVDDARHESKEVSIGWRPDETFEEALKESKMGILNSED